MKIRHIWTIAKLTVKAIWNNRFAFFIVLLTPILICVNYGYVAYQAPAEVDTIILEDPEEAFGNEGRSNLIDFILGYQSSDGSKPFAVKVMRGTPGRARQLLDEKKARAVIYFTRDGDDGEVVHVLMDATEPLLVPYYEGEMSQLVREFSSLGFAHKKMADQPGLSVHGEADPGAAIRPGFDITFRDNAARQLTYFDFFASGIIVLVALALPLALSSLSITLDRSLGVLERIFATPYKQSEIILGKMTANGFLSLLITIVTIGTLRIFFDISLGNMGLILLLTILIAINGVIFGLFLSAVTRRETQSLLAAMISLMLFMSTMAFLWPWETMHPYMQFLSRFTPYLYGIQAIKSANMVGAGWAEVWPNILLLMGFGALQALLTILLFRRRIT